MLEVGGCCVSKSSVQYPFSVVERVSMPVLYKRDRERENVVTFCVHMTIVACS